MAFTQGRVLSINVGQPQQVEYVGRTFTTSIFKSPVEGRQQIRGYNIEGDRQADLRVHGGPYKAIYLYPYEHYAFWRRELNLEQLDYGAFGENLTTEGLLEEDVRVGDQFRLGTAVLQVTQPRMPCFKLQLKFGRADMVKRFWQSGFSGVYFSIKREGEVMSGDAIERVADGPEDVSISDVVRLYKGEEWRSEVLNRALRAPLFGGWKTELQSRLAEQ